MVDISDEATKTSRKERECLSDDGEGSSLSHSAGSHFFEGLGLKQNDPLDQSLWDEPESLSQTGSEEQVVKQPSFTDEEHPGAVDSGKEMELAGGANEVECFNLESSSRRSSTGAVHRPTQAQGIARPSDTSQTDEDSGYDVEIAGLFARCSSQTAGCHQNQKDGWAKVEDLRPTLFAHGFTREQVRKILEPEDRPDGDLEDVLSFTQLRARMRPILRECDDVVSIRTHSEQTKSVQPAPRDTLMEGASLDRSQIISTQTQSPKSHAAAEPEALGTLLSNFRSHVAPPSQHVEAIGSSPLGNDPPVLNATETCVGQELQKPQLSPGAWEDTNQRNVARSMLEPSYPPTVPPVVSEPAELHPTTQQSLDPSEPCPPQPPAQAFTPLAAAFHGENKGGSLHLATMPKSQPSQFRKASIPSSPKSLPDAVHPSLSSVSVSSSPRSDGAPPGKGQVPLWDTGQSNIQAPSAAVRAEKNGSCVEGKGRPSEAKKEAQRDMCGTVSEVPARSAPRYEQSVQAGERQHAQVGRGDSVGLRDESLEVEKAQNREEPGSEQWLEQEKTETDMSEGAIESELTGSEVDVPESKKQVVWGSREVEGEEGSWKIDGEETGRGLSVEAAAKKVADACKVAVLRAWRGEAGGLLPVYQFSLQEPIQALLGACGLVEVLALLLRAAVEELVREEESGNVGGRGSVADRNQQVAMAVLAVLTNLALWEEGNQHCKECSILRHTLSLSLLSGASKRAKQVRTDSGRLAFILDGFAPPVPGPGVKGQKPRNQSHSIKPPLGPIVGKDMLHLAGSRARGRPMVYVSSEEGDSALLTQLTGGFMQAGVRCWGAGSKTGDHDGFRQWLGALNGGTRGWSGGEWADGAGRTGPLAQRYGGAVEGLCQRVSESDAVLIVLTASYFKSFRCRLESHYLLTTESPIILLFPDGETAVGCRGGENLKTLSWSNQNEGDSEGIGGNVEGQGWLLALRERSEGEVKGRDVKALWACIQRVQRNAEQHRMRMMASRKKKLPSKSKNSSSSMYGSAAALGNSPEDWGDQSHKAFAPTPGSSSWSRSVPLGGNSGGGFFGGSSGEGSREVSMQSGFGTDFESTTDGLRRKWNSRRLTHAGTSAFLTSSERFQPKVFASKEDQAGGVDGGGSYDPGGPGPRANAASVAGWPNMGQKGAKTDVGDGLRWKTAYTRDFSFQLPVRPASAHGRVQGDRPPNPAAQSGSEARGPASGDGAAAPNGLSHSMRGATPGQRTGANARIGIQEHSLGGGGSVTRSARGSVGGGGLGGMRSEGYAVGPASGRVGGFSGREVGGSNRSVGVSRVDGGMRERGAGTCRPASAGVTAGREGVLSRGGGHGAVSVGGREGVSTTRGGGAIVHLPSGQGNKAGSEMGHGTSRTNDSSKAFATHAMASSVVSGNRALQGNRSIQGTTRGSIGGGAGTVPASISQPVRHQSTEATMVPKLNFETLSKYAAAKTKYK